MSSKALNRLMTKLDSDVETLSFKVNGVCVDTIVTPKMLNVVIERCLQLSVLCVFNASLYSHVCSVRQVAL